MADIRVRRRIIVDEERGVPPLSILTRIIVPPLGNLLGIVLLCMVALPFAWYEDLGRILCDWICVGVAMLAVPIDVLFRRRRRNQSARVRWFSPYEGGTVFLIPSWIVGPILAGLFVWVVVTHPGH